MKKHITLLTLFLIFCLVSLARGFPAVEVYQKASRAVVLITAGDRDAIGLVGAGSLLSADGLVVTNAHVVVDRDRHAPYPRVQVFLKPGEVTGNMADDLARRYGAEVVAFNTDLDLALLMVKGLPGDVGYIPLADPGDIMVGEEVVAIGHPEQGGLWTLTYGRISGQITDQGGVRGKDVFQTDTSVNRGNSGGPLLDRRGYMVGVNTNIARRGEGGMAITGVNFALKSSVVRAWLGKRGYRLAYGKEPLYGEPGTVRATAEKPVPVKEAESPPGKAGTAESGQRPVAAAPEPGEKRVLEELSEAEQGKLESDTMLTPKKPFTFDSLLEEVEREMEDMMEEMKMKIRK